MTETTENASDYPGFTWEDHGRRIDARHSVIGLLQQVAPMELPQDSWDRIIRFVRDQVEIGKLTPDAARDAWKKVREDGE